MSDSNEFGRRLRYLREREQVTMTRLADATTLDKVRLKDLEAGRATPTPFELQRIADVLGVKPDYFASTAKPTSAAPAPEGRAKGAAAREGAAPAGGTRRDAAGGRRSSAASSSLDFSEFKYFKEEGQPSVYDSGDADASGGFVQISENPLAGDLFDDSDAVVGAAKAAPPQAPAAPPAPAPVAPPSPPAPATSGGRPTAKEPAIDPFALGADPSLSSMPTIPAPPREKAAGVRPAEPPSERRKRGGRGKAAPAAPAIPGASVPMGKSPGSRFAHTRGVTDEEAAVRPAEEPPSRGFSQSAGGELGALVDFADPSLAASGPPARREAPPPPPPAPRPAAAPPPAPPPQRRSSGAPASAAAAPRPAAPPPPPGPGPEIDAKQAALEALIYVKALSEVLLARGVVSADELARALRRAREA
jgi:transcriptional regulator with XRE-family HTH domain